MPFLPRPMLVVLLLVAPLRAQKPGELTDPVASAFDAQQSYALYLPSNYTPQKKWPVIFLFDPGAHGKAAVEAFRAAAEKHGYILAGSNNSRNGPQRASMESFDAMLKDASRRFSLDGARLYAAGFSGGARSAGLASLYCGGCLRAVIACGAGLPFGISEAQRRSLPPYFFTVGRFDFNYFDVVDAARSLAKARVVATFDGSHQWAPPEVAEQALAWLDAGAATTEVPPVSTAEQAQRRRQAELAGRVEEPIAAAAAAGPAERERSLGDARREMAALRKKREVAAGEELVVYRRALGEALISSYERAQQLLREGDAKLAAAVLEIAAEAVPGDPGGAYEVASTWAAAGEKKKALAALRRALELGFHDADAVAKDRHFDALRGSREFQEIVARMR